MVTYEEGAIGVGEEADHPRMASLVMECVDFISKVALVNSVQIANFLTTSQLNEKESQEGKKRQHRLEPEMTTTTGNDLSNHLHTPTTAEQLSNCGLVR